MTNISLIDRLKVIISVITSQSFFITLFIILTLTITILIINVKVKSKAPRYVAAIVYFGLAILVLGRYGHYVLSLNDSIVEKFFKAIYFPNLIVYLCVLIISILIMIANIIDKRFSAFSKIINSVCFFLIWFLFVLIVDTVKKVGLNFYDVVDLYSDKTVMILLQATMYVFVVWMSVVIIDLIVRKLADKMDKNNKTAVEKAKPDKVIETKSINIPLAPQNNNINNNNINNNNINNNTDVSNNETEIL